MKYFFRILYGCVLVFFGVLAGLAFSKGNIWLGIFNIFAAIPTFIYSIIEFDDITEV